MVYSDSIHLSAIIAENPAILSLLNRLGICLGVGNDTVAQSAVSHGIDPEFLLTMINTYLNHDYYPEKELLSFPLNGICDYLMRTNRYYIEVQLPNVGRHFRHLVERSYSPDTNLNRLYDFFVSLQQKMQTELEVENALLAEVVMCEGERSGEINDGLRRLAEEKKHQATESLYDLINLFIIHLRGSYDTNLCHAVINALIALGNDMRQNNRIHDHILSPLLLRSLGND